MPAFFSSEAIAPFIQTITSFPTVCFTFLLLLSILYWLVAMLGLVDIDLLDIDSPDAGGDAELSNPEVLAGLLIRFGLNGVPVTVVATLIAFFGWLICYYAAHFALTHLPLGIGWQLLAGVPLILVALYGATLITAQAIKPIRSLLSKAPSGARSDLLGQCAVVRTSRVDASFGEATLDDGGAGLILKVRSNGKEHFARGDRVVLLSFLDKEHAYLVASETEFQGE